MVGLKKLTATAATTKNQKKRVRSPGADPYPDSQQKIFLEAKAPEKTTPSQPIKEKKILEKTYFTLLRLLTTLFK